MEGGKLAGWLWLLETGRGGGRQASRLVVVTRDRERGKEEAS